MANEIEICNLALLRCGAEGTVESLEEPTREAQLCKALYPIVRDAMLRDHFWAFARKEQQLALLTETVSNWDFLYRYPSDCLKADEIVNAGYAQVSGGDLPSGLGKVKFEVVSLASGTGKGIACNVDQAILIYRAKITNATLYDSQFINTLGWALAAELAMPLRGSEKLQQICYNMYLNTIAGTKANNANEAHHVPNDLGAFVNARY